MRRWFAGFLLEWGLRLYDPKWRKTRAPDETNYQLVREVLDALLYRTPNSTLVPDWREDMARDALAALSELEQRLQDAVQTAAMHEAECAAAERERDDLRTMLERTDAWEARVRELEDALRIIADTVYPATYMGRREDGTDIYGGSQDASRFARAALEAKEEQR